LYNDEVTEKISRLEIMVVLNTHGLHQHLDVAQGVGAQRNMYVLAEDVDEKPNDDRGHGVFGRGTNFLDPRYYLLDKLTPSATQNRLSYLV
jgi:hypothetical protein